jgi:outer membrane protein assembly factor BamB
MSLEELVFVGYTGRVSALNRNDGTIVWSWNAGRVFTAGYVTLLLDGELLIVSVNGYMYGLDALTGEQLWYNEMKGCGTGVASLASVRGTTKCENIQIAANLARSNRELMGRVQPRFDS